MRLVLVGLTLVYAVRIYGEQSIATWTTRINGHFNTFDTSYQQGYSDTSDLHTLGWKGARVLEALHRMYELTGDTDYLADMDRNITNMEETMADATGAHDGDADNFDGWAMTNPCNLEDRVNHTAEEKFLQYGLIVEKWANFILTVRRNSSLASTYGSHANTLEQKINEELIERWDDWWFEQYGLYLDNNETHNEPDPDGKRLESEPTNRYLAMARALYLMAQVSPDRAHYRLWADRMSQRFRDSLEANGNGFKWRYRVPVTPDDITELTELKWEDSQHMYMDTAAAYASYNNGGPFTSTDINAFGHTVYSMWNDSSGDPMLEDRVFYEDGQTKVYDDLTLEHGDLARWQPGLWELYETARDIDWQSEIQETVQNGATLLAQHPDQPSPQSFSLAKPTNGATNQNAILSLQWLPSINASHYTLQVSTSSSFSSYVVNRTKIIGTNAIVRGLNYSQTYYWRVSAKNHDATLSTLSSTFSFTTRSAPAYTLTFCHRDSRGIDATKTGRHYKQVLIDGLVVWDRDIFTDGTAWTAESVNITTNVGSSESVKVQVRVYEKAAVSNNGFDADFDNVSITNTDVLNGTFEAQRLTNAAEPRLWWWTENGTAFTGSRITVSPACATGSQAYRISLPASTPTSIGNYGSIQQTWAIRR